MHEQPSSAFSSPSDSGSALVPVAALPPVRVDSLRCIYSRSASDGLGVAEGRKFCRMIVGLTVKGRLHGVYGPQFDGWLGCLAASHIGSSWSDGRDVLIETVRGAA